MPGRKKVRTAVTGFGNSAGVIAALRCAKLALDRGLAGPLVGPSAYFMKTPPEQHDDARARQ